MLKSVIARASAALNLQPGLAAGLIRRLAPLLVLAAALTAVAMMVMWRDESNYKPVFGQSEKIAVTDMLAVLDAEHVPYRLHPDSGQVLVPEAQLGRVRMLLAAKGVVAKLPAGLELMDRNDPLGVSQFVQDVRFRRGLEGDLAQSMMALDAVEAARVHLSIAKSSSFVVGDGEKSSASVLLTLKPGRTLSQEQIAAAISLVSGSVASLEPQRVSLIDQAGNLLSARVDLSEGTEGLAGGRENDAASHYEDEVRRNVRDILAPVLGEDNYRLSVTAEVDNDRVEETREQYGDTPKLTNEALRDEAERDRVAMGVPGSLSNRPVNTPASSASGASDADNANSAHKNASTRQYAYDRNLTKIKRSRGRLQRLNVAVVLNSAVAPSGDMVWTPDALAKVEKVLASGLGVNSDRGDKLTVSPMAFPAAPKIEPWYRQHDNLFDIAGVVMWVLGLVAGYLLIVRPLLRMLGQRLAPAPAETPLETLTATAAAALPAPGAEAGAVIALGDGTSGALVAGPGSGNAVVPLLENFDLPPPGSPVDVLVDHLKVLAAKEPERVAEVVKQWVQKKNGRTDE
jgi:flagellar M-ring protein FliF